MAVSGTDELAVAVGRADAVSSPLLVQPVSNNPQHVATQAN